MRASTYHGIKYNRGGAHNNITRVGYDAEDDGINSIDTTINIIVRMFFEAVL